MVALMKQIAVESPQELAVRVQEIDREVARLRQISDELATAVEELSAVLTQSGRAWARFAPEPVVGAFAAVVHAQAAAMHREDAGARDELRLALGSLLSYLIEIAEDEPVSAERPLKDVARWLVEHAEVPQAEIAALLDTPVRTLQRWISQSNATAPSGDDAVRLRLLAQLFAQLRHVFTPAGAVRWLRAPNRRLDGQTPVELLAHDPDQATSLVELARTLRFQTAS
jgi:uncharacterized protein (DUF2384 family)